ncbi:hypothetical protein JG687_00017167 [Phytophthora cactorum]|uniref:Uncharacterized protein n=1 Tax=Phytophthora cactorum TaxID=29920 RepID=A0A8T1TQ23_9STRA|nr:hypothetical protein JG687_00017167 [Phytophthora cactorum]
MEQTPTSHNSFTIGHLLETRLSSSTSQKYLSQLKVDSLIFMWTGTVWTVSHNAHCFGTPDLDSHIPVGPCKFLPLATPSQTLPSQSANSKALIAPGPIALNRMAPPVTAMNSAIKTKCSR